MNLNIKIQIQYKRKKNAKVLCNVNGALKRMFVHIYDNQHCIDTYNIQIRICGERARMNIHMIKKFNTAQKVFIIILLITIASS